MKTCFETANLSLVATEGESKALKRETGWPDLEQGLKVSSLTLPRKCRTNYNIWMSIKYLSTFEYLSYIWIHEHMYQNGKVRSSTWVTPFVSLALNIIRLFIDGRIQKTRRWPTCKALLLNIRWQFKFSFGTDSENYTYLRSFGIWRHIFSNQREIWSWLMLHLKHTSQHFIW